MGSARHPRLVSIRLRNETDYVNPMTAVTSTSTHRIWSLARCLLVFINFTSYPLPTGTLFKACYSKWRNLFCSVTRPTAAHTCQTVRPRQGPHLSPRVLGVRPYLIQLSREICRHYTYLGFRIIFLTPPNVVSAFSAGN